MSRRIIGTPVTSPASVRIGAALTRTETISPSSRRSSSSSPRIDSLHQVQLFREHRARPMRELAIAMRPGSLVFFCGSKAFHRVTPLGAGEERITYSFAYVRQGKRLRGMRRFVENIKDGV